jgi:nucleotide-binding universal stress UspA family protein
MDLELLACYIGHLPSILQVAAGVGMVNLLGIDKDGFYKPALRLLGRISFSNAQWYLAHLQQPFGLFGADGIFAGNDQTADDFVTDNSESFALLEKAADEACGYGINAKVHMDMAPAAKGLMDFAGKVDADLVAVGSHKSGRVHSALLGSVGRALAIGGDKSFLIGRGIVNESGPVSAIFATDHSQYSERSLEWLVRMKPKGLRSITLVTAYNANEASNGGHFVELHNEAQKEGRPLVDKLRDGCEASVSMLRRNGFDATYSLKPGTVQKVLNHSMIEKKAELLIMGAQGHGFLERLVLGSVALHQVVVEPQSLLVIRP